VSTSNSSRKITYGAIQGSAKNWAWSFRDLFEEKLSPSPIGDSPPKEVERKDKLSILWAFRDEKDYNDLNEALKKFDSVIAFLITTKSKSSRSESHRGIIAVGKITKDSLKGKVEWDYWPEGDKWDYKFLIEITLIAPTVYSSLPKLKKISFNDNKALKEIFKEWSKSIFELIPSNLHRHSFLALSDYVGKETLEVLQHKFEVLQPKFAEPFTSIDWNLEKVKGYLKEKQILVSNDDQTPDILKQIITALKAEKNILLVGPPGTGKTTIAKAIAEAHNLVLVKKTATGDWSRVDVIGGPMFVGNEVIWRSGALIEALAKHFEEEKRGGGAILLIDEINRANMDKAFGEFFTIFGGQAEDWALPESLLREMEVYAQKDHIYAEKDHKDHIDPWGKIVFDKWKEIGGKGELKVPRNFRIIATMNIYDRRYLFTLGYALLRRFAVIEVRNPNDGALKDILEKYCEKPANATDKGSNINVDTSQISIADKVLSFYKELKEKVGVEIGIALLIDVVKIACDLMKKGEEPEKCVDEAVKMIIFPQLEGLMPRQIEKVMSILEQNHYLNSLEFLRQLYPEAESE
jgi:MoxR-like ATPase